MAKSRNAVGPESSWWLAVAGAIAIVIGIAGSAQFTTHFTTHLDRASRLQDNVGGLRKGDDVRLGGLGRDGGEN
jgi:ABC-type transporter Mla subunit MlaD